MLMIQIVITSLLAIFPPNVTTTSWVPSTQYQKVELYWRLLSQASKRKNKVHLTTSKAKVKQSRYRPRVAQRVPGS